MHYGNVLFFQGGRYQTRVGLLMLLATWMADCPISVAHFLFNTANVPYVSFLLANRNLGTSFQSLYLSLLLTAVEQIMRVFDLIII